MHALTELLVKEEEQADLLIETRAQFFYETTGIVPTHVFVSMDVLRELAGEAYCRTRLDTNHSYKRLVFELPFGQLDVLLIKELAHFLMVGTEFSYKEYYYGEDVPEILWGELARQKLDAVFEKEVLNQ